MSSKFEEHKWELEFSELVERLNELISTSNSILLQCHRNPDPDSLGSVFAFYAILKSMGKSVDIVCPSDIEDDLQVLFPDYCKLIKKVDFKKYDFSKYDLFLINDTASIDQLTGDKTWSFPDIESIVIDHHATNNLAIDKYVNIQFTSNSEIIFFVLKALNISISPEIATLLLTGMMTDTNFMRIMGLNESFFKVISDLIKLGANYDRILINALYNNPLNKVNLIGVILRNIKIETGKNYTFAWSFVNYETFKEYDYPDGVKDVVAERFIQSIRDSDFGVVLLEKEPGIISISFRSINDFDCSILAIKFGGGGHKNAAGATVSLGIDQILEIIKDYE